MNPLEQIRQQCADELDALPYFADIAVLIEDRQDIENEINRALGFGSGKSHKVGAFVLFTTESANVAGSSEFGPVFGEIRGAVQCVELPEINRHNSKGTGKTAWDIACNVASALINFKPASAQSPVIMRDPTLEPILFKLPQREEALPGWQVNWYCGGSLADLKDQVATPAIAVNAGNATLTCATAGAAIFYTLDGTKPNPRKTLYAAPVAVANGQTLKTRAFLAGYLASEIASLIA